MLTWLEFESIGLLEKEGDSGGWCSVWPTRCCEVRTANSTSSLHQKNIFITFWTLIKRHFLSRSDSNSYFPVGPCEYGGPLQALMAGDANAGGFSSSYCPRFKKSLLSSWPLNLCRVSFPAGRAREDPSAQHLRAGLVPQDWDDQDEEDDARPRAICLRLWHPHWGIPTLYTVSGWRWQ